MVRVLWIYCLVACNAGAITKKKKEDYLLFEFHMDICLSYLTVLKLESQDRFLCRLRKDAQSFVEQDNRSCFQLCCQSDWQGVVVYAAARYLALRKDIEQGELPPAQPVAS